MKTYIKRKLRQYLNIVNYSWIDVYYGNASLPYQYNYDVGFIEEVYFAVYEEMCRILKADIIVNVYKQVFKPRHQEVTFRHYHNSINVMMGIIIQYIPDDKLQYLLKLMADLVVQHYIVSSLTMPNDYNVRYFVW
jgi:dynactin complex subunit